MDIDNFVRNGEYINGLYFASCPFCKGHFVYSEKDFVCYSCGRHGDLSDLLAEKNRISRALASWKINKDSYKEVLYALKLADEYYQSHLRFDNAYLCKRGISEETAKRFHLGWADGKLWQHLKSHGVDTVTAQQAGLIRLHDGLQERDTFYNRLMFPIFNVRNQVVGFGGRIIIEDSNQPKYLNSPECKVFHKKENLFGIQNINPHQPVYLVEGYMDALTLQTYGVNAVAVLGTAVGAGHAQLLRSQKVKDIILSLDGDTAGVKNALKGIEALKNYFNVKVLCDYRDCKDPDEFLRKYGKESFDKLDLMSKEKFLAKSGLNPVDIL